MRKSEFVEAGAQLAKGAGDWLDLEKLARVEVSSEDDLFPVEQALSGEVSVGWRAAKTGPQVIRVVFDAPQRVRRVYVHFVERAAERTQEFALFAEMDAQRREVVRQQWTFSPGGATEEVEEYTVDLSGVRAVELRIDPDRNHDPAMSVNYASLMTFRLG